MSGTPPPPGWYENSDGRTRWWDGTAWTDHFQVAATDSGQPAAPPAQNSLPEADADNALARHASTRQKMKTSKSPGRARGLFSSVPGAILVIAGACLAVVAIVLLLMVDPTCVNNTDCGIFNENYWDAFGLRAIGLIAGVILVFVGVVLTRRSAGKPHVSEIDSKAPKTTKRIALVATVFVAVGVVGTVAVLLGTGKFENEPDDASSTTTAQEPDEVEPVPVEYGPDDFEVNLSVKEKQCFGSAGCNVTLRVNPEFVGSETSDETWEVTFKITGDESGPVVQTFSMDASEITFQEEVVVSTRSANTKPKAKITDVVRAF